MTVDPSGVSPRSATHAGRRQALLDLAALMAAAAILIACGGAVVTTAATAFGLSSAGPTRVCFDRGVPPGDPGALTTAPQWLPMGVRCTWSTDDVVVVDPPGWGHTGLAAAATLVATSAAVAVVRYLRRRAR